MSEQTKEAQFADTPEGWASRLKFELGAAKKALREWHDQAETTIKAYLAELGPEKTAETDWNIFTSDTQTKQAILYGNPPKASVTRRYADAQDDVARVAAEIAERLINADIEGSDDSFAQAVGYAHDDRELAGLGLAKVRYVMGETVVEAAKAAIVDPATGAELAPPVVAVERRPNEYVETDWIHWCDVYWNPCRVWHEVNRLFFGADMSYRQLVEKFGEKVAANVPMAPRQGESKRDDEKSRSPFDRARIWEVWCKDEKQVFWFSDGMDAVLRPIDVKVEANGGQADPLGLEGFWPCPAPMFANTTTSKLVPKPDREFAKGLYDEVNMLSGRITELERAIRVVGFYDKANKELARLFNNNKNQMVAVDNWAMLAEKGGIRGTVDWFPLEQVVNALTTLRDQRSEQIEALRQITGMSDIMRGQASDSGATATEQRIKARFGSVRMERRQKELARFASDLQRLRLEVMAKHFAPETLLARCNCENTPDAPLAPQAVQLLQSDFAKYRIEVKPEIISMTDFDQVKQERTEVIMAVGQYVSGIGPLVQQMPGSLPYLLQVLQWMVSGLRGASEIEGVLDQAITAAKEAAQQPQAQQPPDPKLAQLQLKAQSDMAKADKELQNDLVRAQIDVQTEDAKQQKQMEWNIKEDIARKRLDLAMPKPMAPPSFRGPR